MVQNRIPMFPLRLDDEDVALVEGLSKREKLNRSEVIRRAIRHYAEWLKVKPSPRTKK